LKQGLRAFSADRYVILYYVFDRGIEIAAVVHGARDLEGLFRRGER
jgi:plasmid stabilization system protein ParE